MVDHSEARLWADHHHDFADWVTRAIGDMAYAFSVLARLQYERPWARPDACKEKEGCAA